MEEKDFEPAGLIPRSIIRTVERFRQQLRPETIALGIQEFRISRYQVRVSVRYFFILLLLPIAINWGAKNIIIKPLVGYFWNTYGESLFLNSYQAERAFKEMRDFESQLFFEMLLSNSHSCPEINQNFKQKEEVLRNTKISLINLSVRKNINKNQSKDWSCMALPKPLACHGHAPKGHKTNKGAGSWSKAFMPQRGTALYLGPCTRPPVGWQGHVPVDLVHGPKDQLQSPKGKNLGRAHGSEHLPCRSLGHEISCTQNTCFGSRQPSKIPSEGFQQGYPELALQSSSFKEGLLHYRGPSLSSYPLGFEVGPLDHALGQIKGRDYKLEKGQGNRLNSEKKQNRKNNYVKWLTENQCKSQHKPRNSTLLLMDAKSAISETRERTFNFITPRESLSLKQEKKIHANLKQLDGLNADPFKSKLLFRDDLVPTAGIASYWDSVCFAESERIPCYSWPLSITSDIERSCGEWNSLGPHSLSHTPLSESFAIKTKTLASYESRKGSQHSRVMELGMERRESKFSMEGYPNIKGYYLKPINHENKKLGSHDYRFLNAEPYNSDFLDRIDISNCFEVLFQEKTYLLAEIYNQQSITALSNMFGDCIMVISIILLLRLNAPQFTILKSFLIESFYSFNDAIKCFYIILITDFLVGFHSPRGWEIVMEMLLRHLGLPENEEFILLFVGTFPVFLDTAFKYWIFRYLNKISPSTVATYHSMIE